MSLFGQPNIEKLKTKHDVQGLIKALNYQKDSTIRMKAAEALGELKDVQSVQPIISLVKDEDSDVRKVAIAALGQIGDARAVEPLVLTLNDEDKSVQKSAIVALGKIRDNRALKFLVAALNDKDKNVRKEAAIALGSIGEKRALEPLVTTLNDKDKNVRQAVVTALGKIGDKQAVGPLVEAQKTWDDDEQKEASKVLAKLEWQPAIVAQCIILAIQKGNWEKVVAEGAAAVEFLIAALKDEQLEVRKHAIAALGKIGDKSALEPLITVLKDNDESVRNMVTEALIQIGSSAVEPLQAALKDPNNNTRKHAAYALGEIKDNRAIGSLITTLKDSDPAVWWTAIYSLVEIGCPKVESDESATSNVTRLWDERSLKDIRVVEPLVEAVVDSPNKTVENVLRGIWDELINHGENSLKPLIAVLKNKYIDSQLRAKAAAALGKIGDKYATEPLLAALKDQYSYVREMAAKALGEIKDTRALESLIAHKDDNLGVRAVVTYALAHLGWVSDDASPVLRAIAVGTKGQDTVELLIAMINDQDDFAYSVKRDAAEELGKIGDKRAVEPLISALKNTEPWVREKAAEALGQLRDTRAVEPLIASLEDEHRIADKAREALIRIGSPSVEPLLLGLKYKSQSVRSSAAEILGQIRDARAVEALIATLGDMDIWVRQCAVSALGMIGDARGVTPLLNFVKDTEIVKMVIDALMHIFEQSLHVIQPNELHTIINLNNVMQARYVQYGDDDRNPYTREEKPVDCSKLKELAQHELIRRQG